MGEYLMQQKYKAWDKKNNVMREVKEISFYYKEVTTKMAQENKADALARADHVCSNCDDHTDDIFDFEYIDLLQFTNFYAGGIEKSENEIYDGAILSAHHSKDEYLSFTYYYPKYSYRGVVYFDIKLGTWMFRYKNADRGVEYLHKIVGDSIIIGSIQENPKLMESNNAA